MQVLHIVQKKQYFPVRRLRARSGPPSSFVFWSIALSLRKNSSGNGSTWRYFVQSRHRWLRRVISYPQVLSIP